MPILYNCKHDGDQYRITKFDEDMNPMSSYLTTERECDCPAGQRPMCRHREMLPAFIRRGKVNSDWMFDYDRGGWVQVWEELEMPALVERATPTLPAESEPVVKPASARAGRPSWRRV